MQGSYLGTWRSGSMMPMSGCSPTRVSSRFLSRSLSFFKSLRENALESNEVGRVRIHPPPRIQPRGDGKGLELPSTVLGGHGAMNKGALAVACVRARHVGRLGFRFAGHWVWCVEVRGGGG